MNVIKIEGAYQLNYRAEVLNTFKQKWSNNNSFNCIGNPKRQHLLFYLYSCNAIYTLKDGKEIFAPKGSIIYAPEEGEYKVRFIDCNLYDAYNSIGINFRLYDENGTPFCFDKNVKKYELNNPTQFVETLSEIDENFLYAVQSPTKILGLFYILLSEIGRYYHQKNKIFPKLNVIAKGINALESGDITSIKIDDLAKMCNVSPIYFRKLFKEYSGITPIEYKLNATIKHAKRQLLYSDKPIWEIADILGFSSATYFCRIFKSKVGITPTQYRKLQN